MKNNKKNLFGCLAIVFFCIMFLLLIPDICKYNKAVAQGTMAPWDYHWNPVGIISSAAGIICLGIHIGLNPPGAGRGSADDNSAGPVYSDELLREIIAFCDVFDHGNTSAKNDFIWPVRVQFCDYEGHLDADYMGSIRIGVCLLEADKYYVYGDMTASLRRGKSYYGDLASFPEIQTEFAWDDMAVSPKGCSPAPFTQNYPWIYLVRPLGRNIECRRSDYPNLFEKRYKFLARELERYSGGRYNITPSWLDVQIRPK